MENSLSESAPESEHLRKLAELRFSAPHGAPAEVAPWIAERIAEEHGLSAPTSRFLAARGFRSGKEIADLLAPTLAPQPKLEAFPEIVALSKKILTLLMRNEPVTLRYCNDIDSVLGVAALTQFLKSQGACVNLNELTSTEIAGQSIEGKLSLNMTGMSMLLIAALNRDLGSSEDWRGYADYAPCSIFSAAHGKSELNQKLMWQGCNELSRYKRPGFVTLFESLGVNSRITPELVKSQLLPLLNQAIETGKAKTLVELLSSSNKNEAEIYMEDLLMPERAEHLGEPLELKLGVQPSRNAQAQGHADIEVTLDELSFKVEEELRALHERGGKTSNPLVSICGLRLGKLPEEEQTESGTRTLQLFSGSQRITALLPDQVELENFSEGDFVDVSGQLALAISPRKELLLLLDKISQAKDGENLPPRINENARVEVQRPEWPVTISRTTESIDHNLSELLKRKGARLALDFETTVEENQQLCTVCISDRQRRENFFFDFVKGVDSNDRVQHHQTTMLKALLEDPQIIKVIHEEHFERKVSRFLDIYPRAVCDTRTVGQIVRPDIARTGLKEYVWACLGKRMEKGIRIRDWARERNPDGSMPDDLLSYAVCDTEYLAELDHYQQELLRRTSVPKELNVPDLVRMVAKLTDLRLAYVQEHAPELEVLEVFGRQLKARAEELVAAGALPIDGEAGIALHGERVREVDTPAFSAEFRKLAGAAISEATIETALERLSQPKVHRTRLVRLLLQPGNRELGFESILDIDEFLRECYSDELMPTRSVIKPKIKIKPMEVISEVDQSWGLPRVMRELTNTGQRLQDIKFAHPRIPELDLSILRHRAQIEYLFSLGAKGYKGKSGYAAPSYTKVIDPALVATGLRERASDATDIDIEKIISSAIAPKVIRKDVRELLESGFAISSEEPLLHFQDLGLRSREVQRGFFAKVSRLGSGFLPPQIMPGAR